MTQDFTIVSKRILADDGVAPGALRIRDGKIASIDLSSAALPSAKGERRFDVGDSVVMPGLIDTHVHVNEPGRTDWEGFQTAGRAAAAGGITTIVAMPLNCSPVATTVAALEAEAHAASGKCLVDYGFWGGVIPGNTRHLRPLWEAGALGFKAFMVDSGIDEFPASSRDDLDSAMAELAVIGPSGPNGPVLLVHAEDPDIIAAATHAAEMDKSPRSYGRYLDSRPLSAERRAIETMAVLCEKHHVRTHIVHLSASTALPQIQSARSRGVPLTVETCPHYLSLSSAGIPNGATLFKCAPPIREGVHQWGLWKGLKAGIIDLIASDHSPCPPKLKLKELGDFGKAWGGISSLQLSLSVVWKQSIKRQFDLTDVHRWMSAAPAALAGIANFKGRLAPGFDADITIWNPEEEWMVDAATLEHRHKITPYDGMTLRGVVKATFVRGNLVFAASGSQLGTLAKSAGLDKKGLAQEAIGQWVKRK